MYFIQSILQIFFLLFFLLLHCYFFSCYFFSYFPTVTFFPVTFFPVTFFLLLFSVTFFPVTFFPTIVWMIPSFRIWGYVLHVATNSHSASCISIYALYGPCHPLLNAKLAKNPPDDMFGYIIKRLFQITKGRAHCLADGTEVSHNWCFVIDLIQAVACCTLPYHLSCWLGRTDVISSMPSFCSSEAEGVSSTSLMPQIQLIMARSLQWNHSRFTTMEHSQVNAGLIHLATYTGWEVCGGSDRQEFLELSPGHTASGSNGTVTATTKVTKSDFHIKHGAVDIHLSNSSASNGQRLTLTPVADIVLVATSRLVIPLHFLWTQTYTVNIGRSCTVVLAKFLKDITTITRPGTWSFSCWHGALCFSYQPSTPWAWRYTPPGCLRWAPGHQRKEVSTAHQCGTHAKAPPAPGWRAGG